jgi:hypothetical protein
MKKVNLFLKTIPLAGLIFLFQNCSRDEPEKNNDTALHNENAVMQLSYELEAVTYQEILSPGENTDFNFLDEIAAEAIASRQSINIKIYQDGSTEFLIEEKKPKRISTPSTFEDVLPNDIPPIVKTRISAGMAYFYDAEENLVSQHPMEENSGMLEQINRLMGLYDWEESAKAEGAEIETLANGSLLIRKPVPGQNNEQGPFTRSAGQAYTEELIVPDLNLLLGSSLHQGDGELLSRMVYKYAYQEDQDSWYPERIDYEEYASNEVTGSDYVSKTIYYFDNYSLKAQ